MMESTDRSITIDYTNHRGERAPRWILPREVWFGESEWHDGPQWFLRADDLERFAERDFALADIHGVVGAGRAVPGSPTLRP